MELELVIAPADRQPEEVPDEVWLGLERRANGRFGNPGRTGDVGATTLEESTGDHDNKQTLERFDQLAEACEAEQLDQICTPDMTNHALASHRTPGLEGTKEFRGYDIPAGDYEYDVAFKYRFEDGRIAERWALRDDLEMIKQLSGIPTRTTPQL